MKKVSSIFLVTFIFFKISFVQAEDSIIRKSLRLQTCEELAKQAKKICEETMCQEAKSFGEMCVKDGGFAEGMQICVYDSELPELIKNYNINHPEKILKCYGL